jgi:hypothetical protein
MLVPLSKAYFGSRVEACVKSCLRFAPHLQDEIKRRTHHVPTEEDLPFACNMMLVQTRNYANKRKRVNGIY